MQPFIISFFLLLPESWSNSVHHHLFSKLISWSESSVFHFPHISLLAALTPFLPGVKLLVRKIFFVLLVLLVASSLRPSGVCLEKPLINNFSVHFLKVSNFSFYKTSLQVFMIPLSLLVFLVTATTAWLTDRRKMEWLTGWKVFFWRDHFTVTRHAHTKSEKKMPEQFANEGRKKMTRGCHVSCSSVQHRWILLPLSIHHGLFSGGFSGGALDWSKRDLTPLLLWRLLVLKYGLLSVIF